MSEIPKRDPILAENSTAGSMPAPKGLASLVILHARVRLLREEIDKSVEALPEDQDPLPGPQLTPALFRVWTFLALWLAYLYVVVEGYRDSYKLGHPLSDPEIDSLLTPEHTDTLRRFRHKVFHPDLYDHPAIRVVLVNRREVVAWAERLTDAFTRLFGNEVK